MTACGATKISLSMAPYSESVVETPSAHSIDGRRARYQALTLDDLAVLLADSTEKRRWLLLAEFLTEYSFEDPRSRDRLLRRRPRSTGSREWDALLGALAEHLAFHDEMPIPRWVEAPERFLDSFWFPTNTAAARADAVVHAPASFRRRGVFIERRSLERV